MLRLARHLTLLTLLSSMSGCYSMTRIRMHQCVKTDGDAATLELWIDAPGRC